MPVQETAERKDWLSEEFIPAVLPIEPVVEVARAYRGRLPMAVASGGNRPIVIKTLEAVGILDLFDTVVTAEDVTHGKPAPDHLPRGRPPAGACRRGDASGSRTASWGLQSVRAAGMVAIDVRPAYAKA